jgi:hypothetical protein
VAGVRRLIASFLVPPALTRRILREMAAFGDLGAAAAPGSFDSCAALAAAVGRAVAARRACLLREERRGTGGPPALLEGEGESDAKRPRKGSTGTNE